MKYGPVLWSGMLALVGFASVASGIERPELYPGERQLYEAAIKEGAVVSFDTGWNWANWKSLFRRFRERYPGVDITYNDIGSAATVNALEKGRRRPRADTAYYFAASAIDAVRKDLVAPFIPVNFHKLPDHLRDPQGKWFAVHTLSVVFIVNRKLVQKVPSSWADLLKSEYKNSIVYLDPRSTGVGQLTVFAAATAFGGSMDNIKPGVDYLGRLHRSGNVIRVENTTPYDRFKRGEIPIWIGYENDGLKAKYTDGMDDAVEVVFPKEASLAAPYAISLVKQGPNPNAAKLWLNFVMSDVGQALFAEGFVRPSVRDIPLANEVLTRLPTPRIEAIDVVKAAACKNEVDKLWAQTVLALPQEEIELARGRVLRHDDGMLYILDANHRRRMPIQLPAPVARQLKTSSSVAFPVEQSKVIDGREYVLVVISQRSNTQPNSDCGAGEESTLHALELSDGSAQVALSLLVQSCLLNVRLDNMPEHVSPYHAISWSTHPPGIQVNWSEYGDWLPVTRIFPFQGGRFIDE
jgi:putative spermidine/putrescine transport system substrate-binding protein